MNESEVCCDKDRVPLREHAIFLLEALTGAIDINDFQKLSLSLQANFVIIIFFNVNEHSCLWRKKPLFSFKLRIIFQIKNLLFF